MTRDNVIETIYPLSPMQEGILFHSLYAPKSEAYLGQTSFALQGDVDVSAFEQAWQFVIDRHPVLRTFFLWENRERPLQVVCRRVNLPMIRQDWRGLNTHEPLARLESWLRSDREQGFDLSRAPLMRLTLIQLADDFYRCVWSHHHLLLDGWSVPLVLQDVFKVYANLCENQTPNLPLRRPYKDYITWLLKQNPAEAERFWRRTLQGFNAPTPIGVDACTPPITGQALRYEEERILLPVSTAEALRSLARQRQLTMNTLVLGAWALLLSRYSGEEDVVFGATVSGRPADLTGIEFMVGLFINTLPVRVRVSPGTPTLIWLRALQDFLVEMRQYEYSPLVQVQQWSDVPRGVALFESLFVFENYPTNVNWPEKAPKIREARSFVRTHFPITVIVSGLASRISLAIWYDSRRFDALTIQRMLGHMQVLLESIITSPEKPISALPMLTAGERDQLLVNWNATRCEYPQNKCIHQLFEGQAERTPDATAMIFAEEHLTYAELNHRANQLAHTLRGLGVGAEHVVGVCLKRTPALVISLLGVMKAGAAYVPLDPAYPSARRRLIAQDTGAAYVLTQADLAEPLPEGVRQLCWETLAEEWAGQGSDNPAGTATGAQLAYVLYTSGSTGRPKGVAIEHRSAVAFLTWAGQQFTAAELAQVLAATSVGFDLSVFELFAPLSVGGAVVLADQVLQLPELKGGEGVTLINTVPSAMVALVRGGTVPTSVRVVNLAGEVLSGGLVQQIYKRTEGVQVYNLYGPTEATTYATVGVCEGGQERPTIGRPIANTQVYVLEAGGEPVPVGVAGELYLGGAGLARGYYGLPERTAERFVPDRFSGQAGGRLYRTGDRVRYRADGQLEFLGRGDEQVKLRGFRIELGEIETALSQHPSVRENVVTVHEERPGDKSLIAYVVYHPGQSPSARDLRAFLKETLPDYMLPSVFVPLLAFPLTASGKVDRRALPTPTSAKLAAAAGPAFSSSYIEDILAEIWAQVLGVEHVGRHDNFFELGGHSLMMTQIISQIRRAFEIDLPLSALFERPTISELSVSIEDSMRAQQDVCMPPIQPVARDKELPLSFAQQRLWFLDQLRAKSDAYNIAVALQLTGTLDVSALEWAISEVICRHEALRTIFPIERGQPKQVINPPRPARLTIIDLEDVPELAREATGRRLAEEETERPFDLAQGPLLRTTLLRFDPTRCVLLIIIHHIISDGWSLGVFVREIAALYKAFRAGGAAALPDLKIQYADYAVWQRQWLQDARLEKQVAYWKQQLKGAPPMLEFPFSKPRPSIESFRGAAQSITLPKGLSEGLKSISRKEGVTLFTTLLASFKVLLQYYTQRDDLVVGVDIVNRSRPEVEEVIGMFVNQLVLRTDLSGNPSFQELLRRASKVAIQAYAHHDLPFDKLVDILKPQRNLSRNPLFQVMFGLQNIPKPILELPDLMVEYWKLETRTAVFDLSLYMSETNQGLVGLLRYNTDLFEPAVISHILEHYKAVLAHVVQQPEAKLKELHARVREADQLLERGRQSEFNQASHRKLQTVQPRPVRGL